MTLDPDAQGWELPVAELQVDELWLGFQLHLIAVARSSCSYLADCPT